MENVKEKTTFWGDKAIRKATKFNFVNRTY